MTHNNTIFTLGKCVESKTQAVILSVSWIIHKPMHLIWTKDDDVNQINMQNNSWEKLTRFGMWGALLSFQYKYISINYHTTEGETADIQCSIARLYLMYSIWTHIKMAADDVGWKYNLRACTRNKQVITAMVFQQFTLNLFTSTLVHYGLDCAWRPLTFPIWPAVEQRLP